MTSPSPLLSFPEVLLSPEDEFLREKITCISQEGYAMCGTYHLHKLILPG